jgi:hypothetical protein
MNGIVFDRTLDRVDTPSEEYFKMAEIWPTIHALLGGTPGMRDAGQVVLPLREKETTASWKERLESAVLFNAYGETLRDLCRKPFARQVDLKNKELLSPRVQPMADDMDGTGRDLSQWLKSAMSAAINYGLTHCLVDFDQVQPGTTLREELAMGARARAVQVLPTQIISWYPDKAPLQEVRIVEWHKEREGNWKQKLVEHIRVVRTDTWELYRHIENDQNPWALVRAGTHSFGQVPLLTVYANQTGFMTGAPLLADLAHQNVAHFQSTGDQRRILGHVRVPFKIAKGFPKGELGNEMAVSAAKGVRTTNENATIEWVEHGGEAIKAGERDLERTEQRMEVLGNKPMSQESGNVTATGRAMDEGRHQSAMHALIRNMETFSDSVFDFSERWTGGERPEDVMTDIFDNFPLLADKVEDMTIVDRARARKDLSHGAWAVEAKRRDVLHSGYDAEEDIIEIRSEREQSSVIDQLFPSQEEEEDDDDANKGDGGKKPDGQIAQDDGEA